METTKNTVDTTELTTYKGFSKYWKCRDYQYEIGGTYKHDGNVVRCAKGGFHSCELPLDVFNYYGPATSKFALTMVSGQIDRDTESDTKIASGEITIKAELKLPDFIRKSVEWIVSKAGDKLTSGDRAHAASTGDRAHAASTGYHAHAASTGDCSIAAALGVKSTASAGEGGAITLAAYDESVWPPKLVAVRSSMVGENGIEAGKRYRLTVAGEFDLVED